MDVLVLIFEAPILELQHQTSGKKGRRPGGDFSWDELVLHVLFSVLMLFSLVASGWLCANQLQLSA